MQNAHLGNSLLFAEDVANAMGSTPIKNSRGVSQDPFWVLWRTAMPSVLVEVGFITNPDDLTVMRSEKGRDGIAANLFSAFKTFKERYDNSMALEKEDRQEEKAEKPAEAEPKAEAPQEENLEEGILYGVQVLATTKKMAENDPFFAGYKPVMIQTGKIYKYVIIPSRSLKEVKANHKKIQNKFPDNFIVKIEAGKTTPVR